MSRLSAATEGRLERSSRHRALYAPHGYGDELRAVVRTGKECWAEVCLTRHEDAPFFTDDDVALLDRVLDPLASALRTALAVQGSSRDGAADPGLLVVDGDDELESLDESARRWLSELPYDGLELPGVVCAVVRQARLLAVGKGSGVPARARARLRSGGYLLVRGSCLSSLSGGAVRVAVVLEPARPAELAPLIVALADLTAREREVTQLLLRGLPTAEVAQVLWISPDTLRGHVKSIFAKLGVRSRPELAALLYEEHTAGLTA